MYDHGYDTEVCESTRILVTDARELTGLDVSVRYWNRQYHVMIGDAHHFAATEYECRAYLSGMIALQRIFLDTIFNENEED